jgi:membrane protein YqaA with SNARE-associated domain
VTVIALASLGGASLAVGVASALVPLINAELYLLSVALTAPLEGTVVGVVALALGQAIGKLAWFYAGRGGSAWLAALVRRRRVKPVDPSSRWTRWLRLLGRRPTAAALVGVSAVAGLPPLAVVSVAAGASPLRSLEFAGLCLTGRCVRFAAVAWPAFWAAG